MTCFYSMITNVQAQRELQQNTTRFIFLQYLPWILYIEYKVENVHKLSTTYKTQTHCAISLYTGNHGTLTWFQNSKVINMQNQNPEQIPPNKLNRIFFSPFCIYNIIIFQIAV